MKVHKRSISEEETHEKHFPRVNCLDRDEGLFLLEKLLGFTVWPTIMYT